LKHAEAARIDAAVLARVLGNAAVLIVVVAVLVFGPLATSAPLSVTDRSACSHVWLSRS